MYSLYVINYLYPGVRNCTRAATTLVKAKKRKGEIQPDGKSMFGGPYDGDFFYRGNR
jgi:hypothetical protein